MAIYRVMETVYIERTWTIDADDLDSAFEAAYDSPIGGYETIRECDSSINVEVIDNE